MIVMKKARNVINKWGLSMFVALMLLCLAFGASAEGAAATEAELDDYAGISCNLYKNNQMESLPAYVENGQNLFFRIDFALNSDLLREAYRNGEIDEKTTFTVDISPLNILEGANYPTSPDAENNIASDNGVKVFRWWVDETSGKVCLRFFKEILEQEGSVSNTAVAFDGTLHVENKTDAGKINFVVNGENIPLQMRAGYELTKAAGVPYFSTDASSYLVDYTVTLTLDQDVQLSGSADLYTAALTLVDSVEADGALKGQILDTVEITAPREKVPRPPL